MAQCGITWETDFGRRGMEHTPFASGSWMQSSPSRFVELGTHQGQSFMAFVKAADRPTSTVQRLQVDTWWVTNMRVSMDKRS